MQNPRRILVIETLYLGDLIHTLPLIQALRARYPDAALDVLVRAPHVPLMALVPAVNTVLAMDPKQHRSLGGLLALCRDLQACQYDLVLNSGASDRATILTWRSGGKRRLGRLNRKQSKWLWPLLHDQVIPQPWGAEPMYWQKLSAFAATLDLSTEVHFGLQCETVDISALPLPTRYIHLSPFASEDLRCLPAATVVEWAAALRRQFPKCGLVVSCGPTARERQRLAGIQLALQQLDVLVLAGTVTLPQLAAIVARAALHIGPDSGPLHLAVALNTPSIGCFLFKDASAEWMPVGLRHQTIGVSQRYEGGLYGLSTVAMLQAANAVLGLAHGA